MHDNIRRNSVLADVARDPDSPWPWDKLEHRVKQGELSAAEVTQAIEHFVDYLEKNPAHRRYLAFHHQRGFLTAATEHGHRTR